MPPDENGTLELGEHGEMADQAVQAHEQNMAALAQVGVVAQQHFTNFAKLADYDYLEGHRLVGLTEAMGVREVSSKKVPAGPETVGS